jgi:hypothetical protein
MNIRTVALLAAAAAWGFAGVAGAGTESPPRYTPSQGMNTYQPKLERAEPPKTYTPKFETPQPPSTYSPPTYTPSGPTFTNRR